MKELFSKKISHWTLSSAVERKSMNMIQISPFLPSLPNNNDGLFQPMYCIIDALKTLNEDKK